MNMIAHYAALLTLFIAIIIKYDSILIFINNLSDNYSAKNLNGRTTLLVGVLSAQTNFRARKAIRETWGQLVVNRSIELKFLVGDDICPYPLEDRITPYDCELWLINFPKEMDEYSTVGGHMTSQTCDIGFTFLVKTRIVLQRIGLDFTAFSANSSEKARVVLYNSQTGDKVASATFMKENISGFLWKSVPPIILEKGFEGEIKLVRDNLQTSYCNNTLQYIAPVHYFETLNDQGTYSKFELGNFRPSIVGINYTLKDVSGLQDLLIQRAARFKKWSLTMSLTKQQLEDEQKKYGDILFLSGFTDVYDHLSYKVEVFLDWVKTVDSWKYILKTDDDVFVDLPLVEKGLNDNWDLWTCLRMQTPNASGKWRDRNSTEYPPFPSGSGYVLSKEMINKLRLKPRSKLGEDVMLGYALNDGVKKPSNEPCSWACGSMKPHILPACNVAQLNSNQMRKLWAEYGKIGHIPHEYYM